MKTKILLSVFLLACSLELLAQTQPSNLQSQIIGTWKMVSMTGTDTDGKPYTRNVAKLPQYKIITPTHWMYVVYSTDSLRGEGDGGTYELKGDKYIETVDSAKTEFTLKVEGDKLQQDGMILYPDGSKFVLHELYQRVVEPTDVNADLVGEWKMISYDITQDGKKVSDPGIIQLQIFTPSHYMWLDKKNGKFYVAMLSSYTREGNRINITPIIASFPIDKKEKVDITAIVKGNQMITNTKIIHGDRTKDEWNTIHQRITNAKVVKAVTTK